MIHWTEPEQGSGGCVSPPRFKQNPDSVRNRFLPPYAPFCPQFCPPDKSLCSAVFIVWGAKGAKLFYLARKKKERKKGGERKKNKREVKILFPFCPFFPQLLKNG